MALIVPPDPLANLAFQQIMFIARSHALVIEAFDGYIGLATPEKQREEGWREEVLKEHKMVEAGDEEIDNKEIHVTPVWPKQRKVSKAKYQPKQREKKIVIETELFD